MDILKKLNAIAVEYIQGIKVIKAFNKSASSYDKFQKWVLHQCGKRGQQVFRRRAPAAHHCPCLTKRQPHSGTRRGNRLLRPGKRSNYPAVYR